MRKTTTNKLLLLFGMSWDQILKESQRELPQQQPKKRRESNCNMHQLCIYQISELVSRTQAKCINSTTNMMHQSINYQNGIFCL